MSRPKYTLLAVVLCALGLVVKSIVAIDGPRVRFAAGAVISLFAFFSSFPFFLFG
ncbi:hypothetical protein QBC32DRAFT_350336, partial [Pseudoneurospora amorphoporcata]